MDAQTLADLAWDLILADEAHGMDRYELCDWLGKIEYCSKETIEAAKEYVAGY